MAHIQCVFILLMPCNEHCYMMMMIIIIIIMNIFLFLLNTLISAGLYRN